MGDRRDLHSCPTRRSSDLSARLLRSERLLARLQAMDRILARRAPRLGWRHLADPGHVPAGGLEADADPRWSDRKSTRLNSSHANISYAVFCLKKKHTRNSK